jgi:hypothetical protein
VTFGGTAVSPAGSPGAARNGLIVHLDTPIPETLAIGGGHVLHLTGRCYHPVRSIHSFHLAIDDEGYPVFNHSMTRPDVPSDDPAIGDTAPNSLTSGFWVALPLPRELAPRSVVLTCHVELDDGARCRAELGTVQLLAGEPAVDAWPVPSGIPRVAICMTTYNPDPGFFAEQIDSILQQQHRSWICIVCDDGSAPERIEAVRAATARDPRFHVVANASRLGHYRNFERALGHVPADADFVALADQDDVWYPEKLTRTLSAFGRDTTLVYGDMDIVTRDRVPVSHTYWTTRRNNYTDLASLIFANTVTGAASVFRAPLLADILPFPPRIGDAYHDHWIASVALTKGALGYVDAPLHAYRQHEANTLGHHVPPAHRMVPTLAELKGALARAQVGQRVMAELWRRREVYGNDVVRLIVMARILLLRLGAVTSPAKRATLERVADLERAPFGLVRETVAALRERRPTLGAEWHCLRGVLAARLLDMHYGRNRERLFEGRVVRRELTGGSTGSSATAGLSIIEQKTAPLRLRPDAAERRRVNLITPAIDFQHLFAGYIGKLNLALRLSDAGHAVRLVIVDPCDHDPSAWRRAIAYYPGLESLFDRVEVAYAADREVELAVHPKDAFIATTWWTAHLAHRAAQELGLGRFVYLIQEFEPMTFPMGSLYALAVESYALPHCAIFSTELLRDYFRTQQVGVYASAGSGGDARAIAFQNAIATFTVTPETLTRSGPRKLLFYARPEQHAARNMFELGVLALRRLVAAGGLSADTWVVEGIGAGRGFEPIPLGGTCRLSLLPRVSLAEYQTLLPGYDVGLSLMLTPHPSLVPLEMAAAGLVAVTNTYANKTAAALTALSSNLLPIAPTVDAIAGGLGVAIRRAPDLEARVAGSRVAWSRSWLESFDDEFLRRLACFLAAD